MIGRHPLFCFFDAEKELLLQQIIYLLLQQPHRSIALLLSFPEGCAFCMTGLSRTVSCDSDMIRRTVAAFVVHTVHCFTVYLQPVFRCFEQVMVSAVLILVKAAAARITRIFCLLAFYDNCSLTAAVFRIVKAVCHVTV